MVLCISILGNDFPSEKDSWNLNKMMRINKFGSYFISQKSPCRKTLHLWSNKTQANKTPKGLRSE